MSPFALFTGCAALLTFAAVWHGSAPAPGARAGAVAAPAAAVRYSGCNAVRAAGVAPLYRGQPGYHPDMDGDGDGIACEPHRSDGGDFDYPRLHGRRR